MSPTTTKQLGKAQRGSRWLDPSGDVWFWDNGWYFTVAQTDPPRPEKPGTHPANPPRGPIRLNPGQFFTEIAGGLLNEPQPQPDRAQHYRRRRHGTEEARSRINGHDVQDSRGQSEGYKHRSA